MEIEPPDPQAQALLRVIVEAVHSGKVQEDKPETFLTYSKALELLGDPKPWLLSGSRLAHRGLIGLNVWTMQNEDLPKVAALIVNKKSHRPSAAFAESHDWSPSDPEWEKWWLREASRAIRFDWSSYVKRTPPNPVESQASRGLRLREDAEPEAGDYHSIITIEPGKRGGRPCIRGMRITVGDILGWLAAGMSEQEVTEDFPELTSNDIRAALAFAANRERHTEILAVSQ